MAQLPKFSLFEYYLAKHVKIQLYKIMQLTLDIKPYEELEY
jgi:hypothetical protein